MNKAQDLVVAGFTRLSPQDRVAVLQEIQKFVVSKPAEQQVANEIFAKRAGLPLGPMDSGKCPTCGK